MNAQSDSPTAIPSHIPPSLVVDWDMYNPEPNITDLQALFVSLKTKVDGPLCWTARNGGHWVVLEGEDVATVLSDYERFSNESISIPRDPDREFKLAPIEIDPPELNAYRRIIMPPFLPVAMPPLEEKIRELTIGLIDRIVAQGECEFISDFASRLPIFVFLDLLDLPREDSEKLRSIAHEFTHHEDAGERYNALLKLSAYLNGWLDKRRDTPGDDFLSMMMAAEINGRKLTVDELLSLSVTMLVGGLDTVANMLGYFAVHLARHPEHRAELIADPSLIKPATEELMRRYTFGAFGRTVVEDTELGGVKLKKGEMIQVPTMLYGLDEKIVSDPMKVDFHRQDGAITTFGKGVHVCVGQHLARRELRIFLEEWLRRIPEFRIKPGTAPVIQAGLVGGMMKLELEW